MKTAWNGVGGFSPLRVFKINTHSLGTVRENLKVILALVCSVAVSLMAQAQYKSKISKVLKAHVLAEASWALNELPLTITSEASPRSEGGKHDFFSEGDYWWPDASNPGGPYVQRDGQTNPDNFVAHRKLMIRLSRIVGGLASAYQLTGDPKYARHALAHAHAWFVDTATMMNPSLVYAQAIHGRTKGRGIGIIDTIHLMEVVQGLSVISKERSIDPNEILRIKGWFSLYIKWLTTHPNGIEEMNAQNNHGTCWVMQVASFGRFVGDDETLELCRNRYKEVLLPGQMATDGSFPRELARTKPYGYSLFNLDAMTMICQIASTKTDNLYRFETSDGRNLKKGVDFLFPYVQDKTKWKFAKDVMYWDQWPVAQPFLLFGAMAYGNDAWFRDWSRLDHNPTVDEVLRNLPIRNPIIWLRNDL